MPAPNPSAAAAALRNPTQTLIAAFAAWKVFLLAVAVGSCFVGAAYDTSASLLAPPLDGRGLVGLGNTSTPTAATSISTTTTTLVTRLTSWDAIYFTQTARRGYLFEQEWAFGTGLPLVIFYLGKVLAALGVETGHNLEPILGILVAIASHLISVLVLYRLGQVVFRDASLALVAASLHIFSPAGLFLSAPYAESTFSLLSFTGHLLFAESCRKARRPGSRDALILLAGVSFGLATVFRSNGVLNGVFFAWQFVRQLARLLRYPTDAVRRLIVLGIGGLCVAAGLIAPQLVAYQRFCLAGPGAELRPWCQSYLPSIYNFVQQHYWNTGFLRYWTVSNTPLFLLAAPMLCVLAKSGLDLLTPSTEVQPTEEDAGLASMMQSAAVAQLLLVLLTFTSYHVQIISRLSSGYPLWYLWLARRLFHQKTTGGGTGIVTFMVMYASIQDVLFASFLPPA